MPNYEVLTYNDTFPIYELKEAETSSWFTICPERGGIVLSFGVQGKELFYLDKQTFQNPESNIRGGNPILFPISGSLIDQKYEWNGRTYTMKSHGVARTNAWEVVGTSTEGAASIELRLQSSEFTRESYPWDFELRFTYTLQNGTLRIDQQYRNLSDSAMPMYAGFHPYFAATEENINYYTDASRYCRASKQGTESFPGVMRLDDLEESVILLDAKTPEISFEPVAGTKIKMTYSPEFKYVVLWSIPGQPYVCVEPWMAKPLELNNKNELPLLAPGETLQTELTIACE